MNSHHAKLSKVLIQSTCSIRDAMKAIDDSSLEIVLVVDKEDKLIGLATDGDIRRALINNASLDTPINQVMNAKFTVMLDSVPKKQVIRLMKNRYLRQMPIVDKNGRVIDIVLLKDIWRDISKENKVVLMAGGLGSRLRPLTDDIPKPMLKVGDKPILELIINRFKDYGYKDIIISINYKGDMIERYFQDGSDFDVNIEYVVERKRLGTAGAIRLAKEHLSDKPFFVMNCDLLTKVNFERLMKEHMKQKNDLTMAVKSFDYTIPYGVVNINDGQVGGLQEKPKHSCFISAGIYCLSPSVVDLIPDNQYCDITEIISRLIQQNRKVGSSLITEYWMDIGTVNDYDKAIEDRKLGII